MESHTPANDSASALNRELQDAMLKVESRTAAGEFTPNTGGSTPRPNSVTDIEKAELEQPAATGAITHRPTGVKVLSYNLYG
jgi:hypothetical protein